MTLLGSFRLPTDPPVCPFHLLCVFPKLTSWLPSHGGFSQEDLPVGKQRAGERDGIVVPGSPPALLWLRIALWVPGTSLHLSLQTYSW